MDYVIIVAGGKGMRMGSELPKQFIPVAGKPVLMRTIERFYQYSHDLNIIVVLPQSQQSFWSNLCRQYHFSIHHTIVNGGDTRFASSTMHKAWLPFTMACDRSYLPTLSGGVLIRHATVVQPFLQYLSLIRSGKLISKTTIPSP